MALSKTITANGSHGHHKFTLKVNEDRTELSSSFLSFTFTLSPTNPYSQYDWYGWGSRISYSITIGDNPYTGTIPNYNGTSTVTLKSGSNIQIEHESDGTKTINILFTVTDTTGQTYTPGNASASDTFTLSVLHTPPEINNITIEEINSTLINLQIPNNTIVQFLSQKRFTISTSMHDEATLSQFNIYHNNVLIGTSSTNQLSIDFSNVSELLTTQSSNIDYVGLMIVIVDSLGGNATQLINYPVIKYTRPTIENTSSNIKRKTGSGTVLTDNKANLNFVGTGYKTNDTIGNNNLIYVEYKVWNTTEPQSYTQVTPTISNNNVSITNYEISNIIYTSVYNYKIRIRDIYGNIAEKRDIIPTGKYVWAEYNDHVDFLRATVGHKDVLNTDHYEIDSNANGSWLRIENIVMCWYTYTFNTAVATQWGNVYNSGDIALPDFPIEFDEVPSVFKTLDNNGYLAGIMNGNQNPATETNPGKIQLIRGTPAAAQDYIIHVFAIGKWKEN